MPRAASSPQLLQTKLHLPAVRAGRVERERLLERLDAGTALPLTLISSPAGSGKSTLVADWARSRRRPVAWLALDERDNDLQRFFTYAVAALQTLAPTLGTDLLMTLAGPEPPAVELLVTALLNEAALHGELLLVLDDYHVIDAPPVHEAMARAFERLPQNLRLVITTRVDPPLPLARMRAQGRIAEIRTADLRFTLDEAGAFLRDSMGLALAAPEVQALEERTEGWIVGLQMAALSLQGRGEIEAFVRDFTGSHRFVLDYLTEEVLARQTPEVRRFLLECSVLERLSGPLCDAVRGASDSQRTLERLEAGNLFLIPLDDRREWFRFHHLFGSLLQHELTREVDGAGRSALHARAAAWFESHGALDESLDHALAAGDVEGALDLVEREARGRLKRGDVATVRRWFQRLPDLPIERRPRLAVDQAWLLALSLRWDEARAIAERVEPERIAGDAELALHFATLHAMLAAWHGTAEESLAPLHEVLAIVPDHDPLIGGILFQHLGILERALGRLDAARAAQERSLPLHAAAGNLMSYMFSIWNLAGVAIAQGRPSDGTAAVLRALALADRQSGGGPPAPGPTATALVALAELSRERGDLDVAERQVQEALAASRKAGVPASLVEGLLIQSRIHASRGRVADALAAIDEAEQTLRDSTERTFGEIAASYRALYTARAAAAGDGPLPEMWRAWAEDGAASARPASGKGVMFTGADREFHDLARARVLLALDLPAARPLIEEIERRCCASGLLRSEIECALLAVLVETGAGDREHALAALTRALALAEPTGLLQIFADEAPALRDLLRLLPEPRSAFARRVATACAEAPAPTTVGATEQLSNREIEILRLVAGGLSNADAGRKLFIAPATVKKHLENIFGKLDVRNRTQAVGEARRLGILQ